MDRASSTGVHWRDERTWRLALGGAPAAWGDLVRPHAATVYGALAFLLGESLVVRRAFRAAVITGFDRLRLKPDDAPLPAWLIAIGRESAGDAKASDVLDRLDSTLSSWPESAANAMRVIVALPPRARAAAYLRWFGELPVHAIALALDTASDHVSTSLYHAIDCLHRRQRLSGTCPIAGGDRVQATAVGAECREARGDFFRYRDGTLPPERQAAVRRHFATCQLCLDAEARCQRHVQEIACLLAILRWPGLGLGLEAAIASIRPWGRWRRLIRRALDGRI